MEFTHMGLEFICDMDKLLININEYKPSYNYNELIPILFTKKELDYINVDLLSTHDTIFIGIITICHNQELLADINDRLICINSSINSYFSYTLQFKDIKEFNKYIMEVKLKQ